MKPKISGFFILSLIFASLVWSQYSFDLSCLSDTVQIVEPNGVANFRFQLTNTGSLSDVYGIICVVLESVPGWFASLCVRGHCVLPGSIIYDSLNVGQSDTTIDISVYSNQTPGREILSLNVRSLGDPTQKDSIRVYTQVGPGIGENHLPLTAGRCPLKIYPNPFKPKTFARFILNSYKASGELKIYTISGKLVKFINSNPSEADFIWDGRDQTGQFLPPGSYIVTFTNDDKIIAMKSIVIIK
uniref:T9SS type A sorting domain-containing protein n=1 Tax=candidate division WOR-3 bacterium TaxID=2052148 RepID=A0A7C6A9M6_UNCW3